MRDTWLQKRPVVRTGKINKKFTIPAFSANCGPSNAACINTEHTDAPFGGYFSHTAPSMAEILNNLTFEMWIKPRTLTATGMIGFVRRTAGGTVQFKFGINSNGELLFVGRRGGVEDTKTTSGPTESVAVNEWTHTAFVITANVIRFYINGNFIRQSSFVGGLDSVANCDHYLGGNDLVYDYFKSKIDEIRIWDVVRTDEQIKQSYLSYRNITAADSIDDDLQAYYRCDGDDGDSDFLELISGETVNAANAAKLDQDDSFPWRFGASFIAKEFSVNVGSPCSLKFPIDIPDDPNHGLYIRYTDENGDSQRRRLYGSGESYNDVDINPSLSPSDYRGERISSTFVLEFWNVDGQKTIDLEDDLVIHTSLTSNPTSAIDHTQLVAATPVGTTVLACPFPLTDPIDLSTTQTYF